MTCPPRPTDPRGTAWMTSPCVRCGEATGRRLNGAANCAGSHSWQRRFVPAAHWQAVQVLAKGGLL
jgi:hypothetical protein